jgi:hypothetical protein
VRAALIAAALVAAGAARASTPVALAERQVTTLEFAQPVSRLAVTDPDVVALRPSGTTLRISALRAGRTSIEVAFDDGAVVVLDVTVEGARRSAAGTEGVALAPGEERRLAAPGVARVLLEENGVARVRVEGAAVVVTGVSPGRASLVLVDDAGARTTWSIRVR